MDPQISGALVLLFAGAAGALVKDIVEDGSLKLPKRIGGDLFLGFIGSMTVGAVVGYIIDHSFITAFLSGYAGFSAIAHLIPKKAAPIVESSTPDLEREVAEGLNVKDLIIKVAKSYGVDPNLALQVANCESGFNPRAIGVNLGGSVDRGLYQINSKYHPEVTADQAFNPVFAVKFFCAAVKAGNLSWWDASKKCWAVALPK